MKNIPNNKEFAYYMSKAILRALLMCLALLLCISICACSDSSDKTDIDKGDDVSDVDKNEDQDDAKIEIPASGNFDRNAKHFKDIIYKRPDTDALVTALTDVSSKIRENNSDYPSQLNLIVELEDDYSEFLTMYSYANIAISRDSSDIKFKEEFEYLSTVYPKIVQTVEDMMVAAASSPHAKEFEKDYFGDDLIEKYGDGGKYTDALVALLEKEAELEAKFTSLSTATVKISFGSTTDTYDNIEKSLRDKHGKDSLAYTAAIAKCDALYDKAVSNLSADILVDLIKVRRLIADECGYQSYAEYAYGEIYHDYDPEEIEDFLDEIAEHALPIYRTLANKVFYDFFRTAKPAKANYAKVANRLGALYREIDSDLSNTYSYMLHYGLFDIDTSKNNRTDGAFTVYLDDFDSPFVFMTSAENVSDYMTLSHEFGHFYDSFVNYDAPASMDLLEVSSQGLELLTLSRLEDVLPSDEYKYLYYHEMQNAFLTLIFQGLYSKFEHKAYALEYNEITKEKLATLVTESAREMGLNPEYYSDVSSVIVPHIVLYPFYVQSYTTSIISALEIFFMEEESRGDGITAYKALINRTDGDGDFIKQLSLAGLDSPLKDGKVKEIVDHIHYSIMGYHYYNEYEDDKNAA